MTQQQPTFQPFFTLLTTPSSATPIHPKVHYIFSDDPSPPPSTPSERAVIIDIAADGATVLSAHSLSSEFQVAGVSVQQAPSMEGSAGGGGGLMLMVDGVEVPKAAAIGGTVEELAERMAETMERLRRVVEFGERTEGAREDGAGHKGGEVVGEEFHGEEERVGVW